LRCFRDGFTAACACAACACFADLLASSFVKHREPDRRFEQQQHRYQLEERRHEVGPGESERDRRGDEVAESSLLPQRPRAEDADCDESEDYERRLEDQDDPDEDRDDEVVVRLRLDQRPEMCVVVVREEVDRARQENLVPERNARCSEQDRARDEAEDLPLGFHLDGRREEAPQLPEHDREGEDEPRVDADGDRRRERLCDAERHGPDVPRQRVVEPVEHVVVEDVRDDRPDADGADHHEEPTA
jgi:hypothetical protein